MLDTGVAPEQRRHEMKHTAIRYAALLILSLVLAVVLVPRMFQHSSAKVMLETHSAREENIERIDVATLRQAHISIEMFAYRLTDQKVIEALKYAATHGAIVCLYLDNNQTANAMRRSDLRAALIDLAAVPDVSVRMDRSRATEQTRYVIDTRLLREGSAHFSPFAWEQQDTGLLLTDDTHAIRGFELDFRDAWNRPDNISLAQFATSGE